MSRVSPSETVSRVALPASSQMMTLQIDLTLENTGLLEEKLKDLSTPASPNYGKWLTKEEVDALFPATDGAATAVTSWLKSYGVERSSVKRNDVSLCVAQPTAPGLASAKLFFLAVPGPARAIGSV
ncbi:hypothetical protein ONZ43_g2841 [Nemania bipapillata]|uniref:Uncharacterized protein n=1 Tax=Nemania bipapillata TaxID=110536 RepID=A0ACC2IZ22_9PEZI|nr:hypothetical protein ONZ43_g2841 [Nemania bipapillata]